MKKLEVGDVVWFDKNVPDNRDLDGECVQAQPFVIVKDYGETYGVKRFDGKPLESAHRAGNIKEQWTFYHWRFRKDEFLTAARKACADG